MKRKNISPLLVRFISVRREIRYAFLIATFSILVIELFLKNYDAPSQFLYKVGDIYLRICYSIVAATIFFFINQHLPKEERKLKSYRFVNNKVVSIDREIRYIIENLKISFEPSKYNEITLDMITDACRRINPMSSVQNSEESSAPFNNWYEYFNYKTLKIKDMIKDLLILNESMDTDLIERLLLIEDILFNFLFLDKKRYGNTDLIFWSSKIYDLKLESFRAIEVRSSKYDRYWYEYSKRFHKDRAERT